MESDRSESRLLVAEVLNGNSAAVKTLIERYQKLVSHVVFRMITNRSDREDICQEVFIKVYQNLAGFHFESKLSTWIARIAYNACINHLEKKRLLLLDDLHREENALEQYPSDVATPDHYTEMQDIATRVRSEIDKLPVHFRAVVTMYHLEQMSYEEIVEVTGMPLGTVKSHLFRGRKFLKDRLSEKYQLEDIWQ
jgi:RNA polymerase sigma factor (sigma-70 family)